MKHKLFIFLMLFNLVFLSGACKKLDRYKDTSKISSTSWNPNIAVPLAHATFGVYDILAKTDSSDVVVIDQNTREIALVYKGKVVSFTAEDIIEFPNLSAQFNFLMSDFGIAPIPVYSATANISHTETFTLTPGNNVEFNTVVFKSGFT